MEIKEVTKFLTIELYRKLILNCKEGDVEWHVKQPLSDFPPSVSYNSDCAGYFTKVISIDCHCHCQREFPWIFKDGECKKFPEIFPSIL